MRSIAGRFYVAGNAAGPALVLCAPLSFWGGVAVETGEIIDHSHPDRGQCVTDSVLVMPGGRGSSSSSSVLAEALRRGTGPAAIILARADAILTVGAIVAQSLYGRVCPIVVAEIDGVATGDRIAISVGADGAALITIGDAGA
jgi:predicted aconitase with swiveling domain